ncbi:TRAP transporter small permease [Acerihabitans arboris]|uniref:TRAP transporter small permease protein n=1 Tax=Acerihabitans arboris TaxID=2691583 RepID=A0A845SL15_9GAMM|nr:TRAP transporter small permease subunit [Acerihabitans arboris]NDL63258.1 TRAP transporter small permease subunit [Acerihabitans arboris]
MTAVHYAATNGPAWLTRLLMWAGGALFMVTLLSTLLGIIARYFGWSGLEWTFETAEISFIWVTFLGAVLAEIRGENVRFLSLVALCPPAVRRGLQLLSSLVLLGISLWLLASGLKIVQTSAWVPTPVLRLPNGVITLSLVSFAAMLMWLAAWRIRRFFYPRSGEAL